MLKYVNTFIFKLFLNKKHSEHFGLVWVARLNTFMPA